MNETVSTLRRELPRLIEAAKTLEASVLVMLLLNVEKELHKRGLEQREGPANGPVIHP